MADKRPILVATCRDLASYAEVQQAPRHPGQTKILSYGLSSPALKWFGQDAEPWVQELSEEVLVYVHGFQNSPVDPIKTAQFLRDNLFSGRLPAVVDVVLFSWPCQPKVTVTHPLKLVQAYRKDKKNATCYAEKLQELLSLLLERDRVRTVHILAHSMGCRITLRALHRLRGADNRAKLQHLIFCAADVLLQEWGATMTALNTAKVGAGKALYTNGYDLALLVGQLADGKGWPFFNRARFRAGSASPTPLAENPKVHKPNCLSADYDTIDTTGATMQQFGEALKGLDAQDFLKGLQGRAKLAEHAAFFKNLMPFILKHSYFQDCPDVVNVLGTRLAAPTLPVLSNSQDSGGKSYEYVDFSSGTNSASCSGIH